MMQRFFIPPNGFAGQAQQTTANQLTHARRAAANGTRKRRKAKRAPAKRAASSRKRRSSKPARLVKGSAAAKRYMAKIRRKRK